MAHLRNNFQFKDVQWFHAPQQWLKVPVTLPTTPSHEHPFLIALQDFESTQLERGYEHLKTFRFHAGLQVHHAPNPSPADNVFAQVYGLLMAYKLLDILTMRTSPPTDWIKESYLEEAIDIRELKLTRDFDNWVQRLSTIQESLTDSSITGRPKFEPIAIEPTATDRYLYEYLYLTTTTIDLHRTMQNIGAAALHLRRLLQGCIDIEQIQKEEYTTHPIVGKITVGNFKNPLHLALSLSPLILFVPINLTNRTIGRQRMFAAWKKFGRQAPQDIRTAEGHAWTMLFDIAQGHSSVDDSVKHCLDAILNSDLAKTHWKDWFVQPPPVATAHQTPGPSTKGIIPLLPLTPVSPPQQNPRNTSLPITSTPTHDKPPSPSTSPLSPTIRLNSTSLPTQTPLTRIHRPSFPPTLTAQSESPHPQTIPTPAFEPTPSRLSTLSPLPPSSPREPSERHLAPHNTASPPQPNHEEDPTTPGPPSQEVTVEITGQWLHPPSATEDENAVRQEPKKPRVKRSKATAKSAKKPQLNTPKPKRAPKRALPSDKAQQGEHDTDASRDIDPEVPRKKKPRAETPDSTNDMLTDSDTHHTIPNQGAFPLFTQDSDMIEPPIQAKFTSHHSREFPSKSYTIYDVLDQKHTIQLSFHTADQRVWFEGSMEACGISANDDTPRPANTSVRVMSQRDACTNHTKLMRYFQKQHLVVTDQQYDRYPFDVHGLETVFPFIDTDLQAIDSVDQSTKSFTQYNPNPHMFISANSSPEKGKMMRYDGPKLHGPYPHASLSTDTFASHVYCSKKLKTLYSSEYLQRGHASTQASYSTWDRSRYAGYFESVVCGSRLFLLSHPKKENPQFLYDPNDLANFDPDSTTSEHWDVEAVLVPAGSQIYIQPFTPYTSISLTASISHGAFFVPCNMIERVIIGEYQHWATTRHPAGPFWGIRLALIAILFMWKQHYLYGHTAENSHTPALDTREGARQLLCLCTYAELLNISYPEAYLSEDFSLNVNTRKLFITARKYSRQLMDWFSANFVFTSKSAPHETITDLQDRYLKSVLKALWTHSSQDTSLTLFPSFTRITQLITLTFHYDPATTFNDVEGSYSPPIEGTFAYNPPDNTPPPKDKINGYTLEDLLWSRS
ncbi:hypothetical protein BDN72DRAFT_901255 [Pluteus cervinus]|uniref:Uncharacterized protein n=1 Tax=Pluteus cervinus TaxID=181527 RepID=A0ACD3AH16_9AGAR|nr:hypothetical protein BDN72DRAFT_901255 [Pluteus cervinus]